MTREVPTSMTEAWKSRVKFGKARRPVVRATVELQYLHKFPYDTAYLQGGSFDHDRHRRGNFKSFVFGNRYPYREIPNIMTCEWERSVGQDAATCTIVLRNTELRGIGEPMDGVTTDDYDKPGFFTYNRGQGETPNRWGHDTDTGWQGILVPDRVIKTYEGYGHDPGSPPPLDPFLVQTGVWMVDKVTYNDSGTITLVMRDLARLLLDQIVFPPGIPNGEYPLTWVKNHSENVPGRDCVGGHWKSNLNTIGTARSSNDKYVGKGYTNAPYSNYVSNNGSVEGHHASHPTTGAQVAADDTPEDSNNLYWRSTGQDAEGSFVWWEMDFDNPKAIGALRLRMVGGPYRVYVSVHNGDKWVGKRKIAYARNGVAGSPGNEQIDADIPFVKSVVADRFWPFDVVLPRAFDAKKIRITITRLQNTGVGEHPFNAAIRQVQIYTAASKYALSFQKGEVLKVVGNYGDYTHIIKWVCAWAGFFWPPHSTDMDIIRTSAQLVPGNTLEDYDYVSYDQSDPVLPIGRVWGDFMKTGTGGVADLTVDMFDKKPLMDIVNYVRDLIGYLFFVDETGGVVWRQPNVWTLGNYISPQKAGPAPGKRGRGGRTSETVVIDEDETLWSYETTLDSGSIRERVFVANQVGRVGTVIKGFNPYPVGLNRVVGWSDQHFRSKNETRIAAEMLSSKSMFTYRTSSVTIPGYPKIQVDDQVRIYERVTNETYLHYVTGIKSSIDMDSGEWTYDLSTHWLGENPETNWAVDSEELSVATKQYLAAIGYTGVGAEDNG